MSTNQSSSSKDDEQTTAYKDIDQQGFNWHICALTGLGIFANSYSLFSLRVLLPLIAFSNWKSDDIHRNKTRVNISILTGYVIGQLLFGYLPDRYGRLKFYGYIFIALAYFTVAFAQTASGFDSMSMTALLMVWGFFAGVCNGAGQPLAATITAEFAPVQLRARMMAAVFLMQPLGQLAVSTISLITLVTISQSHDLAMERNHVLGFLVVDKLWRIVVVANAVPAFIAFLIRLTSPESPRYTLEVDDDYFSQWQSFEILGIAAARTGHDESDNASQRDEISIDEKVPTTDLYEQTLEDLEMIHVRHEPEPKSFSYDGIKEYFWAHGNWRRLLGTSSCWFLFGTAYSGLGMSSPWISANSVPSFLGQLDPEYLNSTIYEALMQDSIHMAITISAGSLLGSIILVTIIDYVPRRKMLVWSFLALAALFAIAGGSQLNASQSDLQPLRITLYIVSEILCNLGPNTLLFIISTEIFPTCYRTTCHGISAAFGTFGSLLITSCIRIDDPNGVGLHWVLVVSSALMASGAIFAWACIPELQDPPAMGMGCRLPSKSLEALGTRNNGLKTKDI